MSVLGGWWVGQQRPIQSLLITSHLCHFLATTTKDFVIKQTGEDTWQSSLPHSPPMLACQCRTQGFLWCYSHPPPNSRYLYLVEKSSTNSPARRALLELNSWKPSGPDLWESDKALLSGHSAVYCSTSQLLALKICPLWLRTNGLVLFVWYSNVHSSREIRIT